MDSIAKILSDLAQLHGDGHLTDAEFAAAKEEALGRRIPQPGPSVAQGIGTTTFEPSDDHAMPWNWKRIPDFKSRTRRSEWWATWAIAWAVLLFGLVVAGLLTPDNPAIIVWLSVAVFLGLYWGASVNRLHDLGMSGWWVPATLVPLLGLWIFALTAFKKGDPASNRWGNSIGSAVPLPNSADSVAGLKASEPASGTTELDSPDDTWRLSTQLWVAAAVLSVIAAALGFYMFATSGESGSNEALSGATSSTAAQTTGPIERTTPTNATASTLSIVETKGFDAQVRDFLILVSELETNGRHIQVNSDNWYDWQNEYPGLADQYRTLAERWDRRYSALADRRSPGIGELLSHALIRRSDGYELIVEALNPEVVATDDDGIYFAYGQTAMFEASDLIDEVWTVLPDEWKSDSGSPGSAMDQVTDPDVTKPDPIPVGNLVVGDCYENPDPGELVSSVERARCVEGRAQVYWIQDISTEFEGFPGDRQVAAFSEELCAERASARFSLAGWDISPRWWYPTAESWADSNARVTCVLDI